MADDVQNTAKTLGHLTRHPKGRKLSAELDVVLGPGFFGAISAFYYAFGQVEGKEAVA